MALTITIPGAVEATIGATAPAVLTIGVGTPGATGPQGAAGPGVPVGGTAGQFLTKINGTDYNTDWTTVNLSQYAVKANNLSDLASASTARTNLGLGTMATATAADYSTTTVANGLYYPLSGNPSAFLTASALTPYLTSATAATTYAPIAAGQPTSGTVGQVLTKNSGTNYDSSWATLIPGDRYLTSSTTSLTIANGAKTLTVGTGLSYSSQQDVVIAYDAANHMHAVVTSYDSSTGALVVDVQNKTGSGTYAVWTVNVGGTVPLQSVSWGEIIGTLGNQTDLATALNAKLETSTAATTYAPLAGAVFTGEVSTPASTTASAGLSILPGTAPSSPTNGEFWNTGSDLQVQIGGVTETLAEQSWVSTNYAAKAGTTFTGLVTTAASTTASAGFNVAHGAAPTTPVNGDIWTTTGGLFVRINAGTQQFAALSTNNTFSNASSTYGSSTATGTTNLASGATVSASTKTVNVATGGVSGSTTLTTIGPVLGASTTSIGGTTAASTLNLAAGATLTATTKAVNIGTSGVAGSTTNIAIGSTTGTSTTTLQGTTNGVTAAADTNSVALATTAYVVGQAGSATPVVDGTAAVGTSLRYARQDHVHPTDTSRAALASPTFTGTPLSTTAAIDTNTTQIATTAFVVGQGYAKLASPTLTGTPLSTTAAVDTNTTQIATTAYVIGQGYAKLASPTFTGTPTLPTGTIATTQTAGNNTTAVATTAFVTAAVPAFAATADINSPSSTTKVMSPDAVRRMLLHPGFQLLYLGAGQSSTASGGAYSSFGGRYKSYFTTTTAGSLSQYTFDTANSSLGLVGLVRGQNRAIKDYSKKIYMTGRAIITGGGGSSAVTARIQLGGKNAFGSGDMLSNLKGFGWKVAGGGSQAMQLQVSNGTTVTTVTSSFSPVFQQIFDWELYSDGAGNVSLTINDSVVATTTAGPTGTQDNGLYLEGLDTVTGATNIDLETYGTKIYFSS